MVYPAWQGRNTIPGDHSPPNLVLSWFIVLGYPGIGGYSHDLFMAMTICHKFHQ